MPQDTQSHETQQVVKGFLLLLLCHTLTGLIILGLGFVTASFLNSYAFLGVWVVGAMGFVFWQLLYVIPLCLWLKRQGKIGMMKGVIIAAILTALVNGACFLTMWRR